MSEDPRRDAFLDSLKQGLDQAGQRLDGATATRLRAARREAIASLDRPRRAAWLLPAGGLAVAATVTAISVGLWQMQPPGEHVSPLEDVALLSDPAGPEFYEELEFYMWLEEQARNG